MSQRESIADNASEHLKLAQWCKAKGLSNEQRAHLVVATHLDPADARAPKMLGMRQYRGRWLAEDATADERNREKAALREVQVWREKLAALAADLASSDAKRCSDATAQLEAIRDPMAIPALEQTLLSRGEPDAQKAVQVIGRMPHVAATRWLAFQAVWHASPAVRGAAAHELRKREPEHFVGNLIALLRPLKFREEWTRTSDGRPTRIVQLQDFGKHYIDVLVGADPENPFATSLRPVDGYKSRFASMSVASEFRTNNARDTLITVTGKDFGPDPQGWIDWWRTVSYTVPGEIAASPPVIHVGYLSSANLGTTGVAVSSAWSCFVAGTPVWTRRGPVAIDQVRLGDLALSRNIETGELAYRPVVNRTIRHRGETVEIGLNGESIRCTPGHMFRMADQSWLQAKDLRPGNAIRSSEATIQVDSMSEGNAENVYNLVVDEFNTYFVGQSKLLVHDITPITDLPSSVSQTEDQ